MNSKPEGTQGRVNTIANSLGEMESVEKIFK